MNHHKYVDENDIIFDTNDETYLLFDKETIYRDSKLKHYFMECNNTNRFGYTLPKVKNIQESLLFHFKHYIKNKGYVIFNLYYININFLNNLSDNLHLISKENLQLRPKLKIWVRQLYHFFSEPDNSLVTEIYSPLKKSFILHEFIEVWRRILDEKFITDFYDKHDMTLPNHLTCDDENIPKINLSDYDTISIGSNHQALSKLYKLTTDNRIIWINLTSMITRLHFDESEDLFDRNGKIEYIILSGNKKWVDEAYLSFVLHDKGFDRDRVKKVYDV